MRLFLLPLMLWAAAVEGAAPREPEVEVGVGAVVLVTPDYRGSSEYGWRVLPIPYVSYRTDRVQITRQGVRARLLSLDRTSLTVSGATSLPGSGDNRLRSLRTPTARPMTAIDPTFEFGPAIDYRLYEASDGMARTLVRVPLRAVVSVDDFHFHGRGLTLSPHVLHSFWQVHDGWELSQHLSAGPLFASEDYHDYYYGVARRYAIPGVRPEYRTRAGYSGFRATTSSGIHFGDWRVGVFASFDWLRGAVFEDSPLIERDHSMTAGAYVSYRFYRSVAQRPVGDETQ
ncbi:MAG TPA: MipA/OmpV family protein [Candidatus Binatia bacterium]|nr:MipA/OmpV family protein [Candidatus Binatia bacterium]